VFALMLVQILNGRIIGILGGIFVVGYFVVG